MHDATKIPHSKTPKRLFVCGGGTGGHFFSGVAVGEKFLDLYPHGEVYFVGTRYGIEARYELKDSRMKKIFILSRGVKGKSLTKKISGLLFIFLGVLQSLWFLIRYRPQIVMGVGGYASAPTVFASIFLRWLFRWKVAVLDQNSSPGLVNKVFSRLPVLAYCAFEFPHFALVDLPLRKSFLDRASKRRSFEWPPKTILIVGGSQGAAGLNERWIKILPELIKAFPGVKFTHQTGKSDEEKVRRAYEGLGLTAEVFAFSDELYRFYDQADLVICRSGAMSVFEVLAFARPAIFVPFPRATDDHQTKNALSVQSPQWVVAESALTWERLKPLLDSRNPSVPNRDSQSLEPWEKILSLPSFLPGLARHP